MVVEKESGVELLSISTNLKIQCIELVNKYSLGFVDNQTIMEKSSITNGMYIKVINLTNQHSTKIMAC